MESGAEVKTGFDMSVDKAEGVVGKVAPNLHPDSSRVSSNVITMRKKGMVFTESSFEP